uniref:RING-type domain-containing protein n=1 Tax=Meloidogyne enterolobii TaxID=390850 RepID=A0A6V7WVH9_MELEN|nr:unnamed protein product [Meloidogyne enterolobii]
MGEINEAKIKLLQQIKEKEKEINNSDEMLKEELVNLKIENENLKKMKEESDKKLDEKCEENIKLKEENYNFARESEKNKFLIKQLENEKLKNLNEYEGEIEKIQSKVEELEKEKKYALDLYTNLEMKFEDFKNELNSENVSLKADNKRLKKQVMEQSCEEGLTSLKLSTENKKVQSENDQLKEELNDYEFVLAEYSVKHEELKKSIDELNNQITSMNELAKMLREENSKLQTDRDILIKRVEEFEFLMDEYSVERGQFMETIETMKELIKNKEKELEEEKEKVEELNISNKNLEEEFNKIKTEHINLTAKNVKLNTKLENEDKLYCNDTSTSQQLSEPIKLFVPADIREVFPGRFLGPGGRSQRELELACRCKLKIDGKGVRNSTSEEEMHVIISPSKLSAYPDVSKAKSEVIKLFKLGLMDPGREDQLAEVARIKKEELRKKQLAESERNEQKIREERLAFLEDIKKCQEEKDKELLESFKCSVCFEQFGSTYRVPVIASCSHTTCSACVKRILQENQCYAEKNSFKCPRCRGQTPMENLSNKNYQLIEAMKAMKMYEDDSNNPPIYPAVRGFWNGMQ